MGSLLDPLLAMLALFPYLLEALALFLLGKLVFDLSTPRIKDNQELVDKRNPAFAIFWGGYMGGLALAVSGALLDLGPDLVANLINIATSGVAAILLLRLSMALGQLLVLRGFDVSKEIVEDRNLGAGFAFAGLFLASGLIISGVMTGSSPSWGRMLLDIAVYWAAGQAFLVAAWFAHRLAAGHDVLRSIGEDNNAAMGLGLGGFFVAMGIVLRAALSNAGSNLGAELLVTLGVGVVGLVFLSLARAFLAAVLLPKARLSEEVAHGGNIAAGLVSAVSYIAVALLLGALVASQLA
jgi:uncharacterized membrane protein YjfL (UPF0719 family)